MATVSDTSARDGVLDDATGTNEMHDDASGRLGALGNAPG